MSWRWRPKFDPRNFHFPFKYIIARYSLHNCWGIGFLKVTDRRELSEFPGNKLSYLHAWDSPWSNVPGIFLWSVDSRNWKSTPSMYRFLPRSAFHCTCVLEPEVCMFAERRTKIQPRHLKRGYTYLNTVNGRYMLLKWNLRWLMAPQSTTLISYRDWTISDLFLHISNTLTSKAFGRVLDIFRVGFKNKIAIFIQGTDFFSKLSIIKRRHSVLIDTRSYVFSKVMTNIGRKWHAWLTCLVSFDDLKFNLSIDGYSINLWLSMLVVLVVCNNNPRLRWYTVNTKNL